MIIYTLIAIFSFATFLFINYKWLKWIVQNEDRTDSKVKLAVAIAFSIIWFVGIPLFGLLMIINFVRSHCIPKY